MYVNVYGNEVGFFSASSVLQKVSIFSKLLGSPNAPWATHDMGLNDWIQMHLCCQNPNLITAYCLNIVGFILQEFSGAVWESVYSN